MKELLCHALDWNFSLSREDLMVISMTLHLALVVEHGVSHANAAS